MTLTEAAYLARRIIRLTLFSLILLIVGRFVFLTGIKLYNRFFPKPPPPPTVSFGKLPKINFPERSNLPNLEISLQTPDGNLPTFATTSKVYLIPRPRSSLFREDDARSKARQLGFTGEEEKVSDILYRFKNPGTGAVLEINIVLGTFSIDYNLDSDPNLGKFRAPTQDQADDIARSFLAGAGLLAKDLSPSKTTFDLFKKTSGGISPAVSLSEANFVRVNFFRDDYDNLPVKSVNSSRANVWFLVSGSPQQEKKIIAGEYHYFEIDEQKYATYPIKTTQLAFEELKNGKGFIAELGDNKDGKITIRRVLFGYYDPENYLGFLEPIFIFEGDRDFTAYVPAVTADFYGE